MLIIVQATQIVPHFACPSVTASDRSRLLLSLKSIEKVFPKPILPSTNALTRFLAGYFSGFYPHYPFTHAPTFKLEACSPELSLAMMAVGAQERFETSSAKNLFNLSKALLLDSQQQRSRIENGRALSDAANQLIDEMRCLLCLA